MNKYMTFKNVLPNQVFRFISDSYTEYKKLDEDSAFKLIGYDNYLKTLGNLKRNINPESEVNGKDYEYYK